MKKTIIILLLFLPTILIAQEEEQITISQFQQGHEFRIGLGVQAFDPSSLMGYYHDNDYLGYGANGSIGNSFLDPSTYSGSMTQWGAVHAAYTYRFSTWFELSGVAAFSLTTGKTYYQHSNEIASDNGIYVFSLAPSARFVWYRNNNLTMYSAINIGASLSLYGDGSIMAFPIFNVNYFGLTIGRDIYWFADLSFGNLGYLSTGVGVRL